MSYEGYTECLCANGHYSMYDAYQRLRGCQHCDASIAWMNDIDTTNDGGYPYDNLITIDDKRDEICLECGQAVTHPARYKIPTEEDMVEYRKRAEAFYERLYGGVNESYY